MANMFKSVLSQPVSGVGAIITVTCDEAFAGLTISCTSGTQVHTKTCPSSSPYEVEFKVKQSGTWIISGTIDGNTFTTSIVVTLSYIGNLLSDFNWKEWVDTSSQLDSSDYESLEELLEDELAIRELCLEHACVDFLCNETRVGDNLTLIINNDIFAKWVNNSDYALDNMEANSAIKEAMDEADKYGYGEWTLQPQVPKMTSNSAPYGEASASSANSGYEAYKAFDGNTSDRWSATDTGTSRIVYKFTSPICINEVSGLFGVPSGSVDIKYKVQASNTNASGSYVDLSEEFHHSGQQRVDIKLDNTEEYLYYSILCTNSSNNGYMSIGSLQFYAWAPKGNVPVMTANNAPYGEVIGEGYDSGSAPFYAFDGNNATQWCGKTATQSGNTTGTIAYHFANPACIRMIEIKSGGTNFPIVSVVVKGSNDGTTYTSIQTISGEALDGKYKITNDEYYLYYACDVTQTNTTGGWNAMPRVSTLQFYGRELKVSVPKMDSATPPFGSLIYNIDPQNDNRPWYAFDNSATTAAMTKEANQVPFRIGYDFEKLVRVAYLAYIPLKSSESASLTNHTDTFYYSLDGITWSVLATNEVTNANAKQINLVSFDPIVCKAIKYETSTPTMSNGYSSLCELLVFGEDYSEKEFEEGTTKKWLYDHGVELETLNKYKGSNTSTVLPPTVKDELKFDTLSGTAGFSNFLLVGCTVDLSDYSLLRSKVGSEYLVQSADGREALKVFKTTGIPSSGTYSDSNIEATYSYPATITNMNDTLLSVSSFNEQKWVAVGSVYTNGAKLTITELWLE